MDLTKIKDKWESIVRGANRRGIPIPMVRDPSTGLGSVSLTLVFISFNVWLVSVIGKAAGALGGVDASQCLQMFLACAGLYWGRKFQSDGKGKVELSQEKKKNDETQG